MNMETMMPGWSNSAMGCKPAGEPTELDKAIEQAEFACSGGSSIRPRPYVQQLLLAAKRTQELEHKFTEHSNAELLGETERCQFEAMKVRLKEVEKERDELQAKVLQLEPETVALTYDVEQMREHLANVNRENMDNRNAFENEYKNHQDTTKHCDKLRDGLEVCKVALEHQDRYWHNYTPILIANSTLHLQIIERALSHPAVQAASNPPPP